MNPFEILSQSPSDLLVGKVQMDGVFPLWKMNDNASPTGSFKLWDGLNTEAAALTTLDHWTFSGLGWIHTLSPRLVIRFSCCKLVGLQYREKLMIDGRD